MEHENTDAQVRELLMDSDRQGRTVDYGVYSKMMKKSFEHVRELRAEKFKFSDICEAYAKAGALPPNADSSSFRKAFRNEAKRRARSAELEKRVADERNAPSEYEAKRGGKPAVTQDIKKIDSGESGQHEKMPVSDEEALKKKLGFDKRLGTSVIKLPDGSFDF